MFNFFQNFFSSSNNVKKQRIEDREQLNRIYFDRKKKSFLEIKLKQNLTCQQILDEHKNEILIELRRNKSSKRNLNNYKINELFFIILDDENPFSELKLKLQDTPIKFLKKLTTNLYYINTSCLNQDNDNKKYDKTENTSLNKKLNEIRYNINIEESIREGELLKYSFKNKTFNKRIVILDKEKIIITKSNSKESTILLLSEISSITKNISEKKLINDKCVFEIVTYEGDQYILKSKHIEDLESWIDTIHWLLSLIRDNRYIINFQEQITKLVKDSYQKQMTLIYNCLSIKGVLKIKEARALLYSFYEDKFVCNLMEALINYKTNSQNKQYIRALKNFDGILGLLGIQNFETENYNKALEIGLNNCQHNQEEEFKDYLGYSSNTASTSFSNGSFLKRKNSGEDNIRKRTVIFENTNKLSLENINPSTPDENNCNFIKEEKSDNINISFSHKKEMNLDSVSSNWTDGNTIKSKQDSFRFDPNKISIFNEQDLKRVELIRELFSPKMFQYLSIIRREIANFKIDINCSTRRLKDCKLNDYLQPNIFNEIIEALITKYFYNFYKKMIKNPKLCGKIEKILVHYYKLSNNLFIDTDSTDRTILNLTDYIENS